MGEGAKQEPTHLHEWQRDGDGEVDIFAFEEGFHNGPRCVLCGEEFCHHCTDCYTLPCPASPSSSEPTP